jgi:hypothetical protein
VSIVHLRSSLFLTSAASFACSQATEAQPTSPQALNAAKIELVATIAALDSAMFSAFNTHDADLLGTYFTSDLEFYHDKGGLTNYDSTMASFRGLFARNAETGLHRELVPGSLEVYPIGDFGLLEVCQHRFCHTENGKEDCGTFKNIMVWRKEGTGYKVSRVISYDH